MLSMIPDFSPNRLQKHNFWEIKRALGQKIQIFAPKLFFAE
jgi:hypothetical protein